jgi:hypothetical protein
MPVLKILKNGMWEPVSGAIVSINGETMTDEEVIEMLIQTDMIPVVTDSDYSLLTDENENILLW